MYMLPRSGLMWKSSCTIVQHEVDGKVQRLEGELELVRGQLATATESERQALERLRTLQNQAKLGDAVSTQLRASEDRYVIP